MFKDWNVSHNLNLFPFFRSKKYRFMFWHLTRTVIYGFEHILWICLLKLCLVEPFFWCMQNRRLEGRRPKQNIFCRYCQNWDFFHHLSLLSHRESNSVNSQKLKVIKKTLKNWNYQSLTESVIGPSSRDERESKKLKIPLEIFLQLFCKHKQFCSSFCFICGW